MCNATELNQVECYQCVHIFFLQPDWVCHVLTTFHLCIQKQVWIAHSI